MKSCTVRGRVKSLVLAKADRLQDQTITKLEHFDPNPSLRISNGVSFF